LSAKRLGAVDLNGTIGTAEQVYACPIDKTTVLSTIVICNRDSAAATYRIGISTGTSYEDAGYIVYGATVPANDSVFLTIGAVLDPTNRYLLASASSTSVSVSAFGIEE